MNPPEMMFFVVTPSLHFVLILTKTTPTPTSLCMRSWEISGRLQTEMKKTRGASGRSFNSRNFIIAAEWYTFEINIFMPV